MAERRKAKSETNMAGEMQEQSNRDTKRRAGEVSMYTKVATMRHVVQVRMCNAYLWEVPEEW